MTIHKAYPRNVTLLEHLDSYTCMHCGEDIRSVPGGHGPTWVHSKTGTVAGSDPSKVYVLHGMAYRDYPDEPVCQFFATEEDRDSFIKALPGTYHMMTLVGISYDDFEVELP